MAGSLAHNVSSDARCSINRKMFSHWEGRFPTGIERRSDVMGPLPPAIHRIPPEDFQPFLKHGFGPLAMLPPAHAENPVITRSGYGPVILREPIDEDRPCSRGVPVAGHQQDCFGMERIQALGHIARLRNSAIL